MFFGTFLEKFFLEFFTNIFFRNLSINKSDFKRKVFGGFVETDFEVSIGTFCCFFSNVNLFTPNWQITEEKVYILRE